MERKSKSRLLIGGLIVFSALIVVYTYWVFLKSDNPTQDWQAFMLNVSTELIGALIVFFFFNLFFFLDDWDLSERVTQLLHKLERERPTAEKFFHKMPEIGSLIQESQTIDLCGVSLTSTINRQFTLLRDGLIEGKSIRLLIIDPRSTAIEMANARSESQNLNYYIKRLETSLNDISYLNEKWKDLEENGRTGSLMVRLMPYAPSFGIQIFQNTRMKGQILVEMYPHHSGYGSPPVFSLDESDDSSWFKYFKSQFEEMWEQSVDWTPQLFGIEKQRSIPELSIVKAEDFFFDNNPDLTPYFERASDIYLYGIGLSKTIKLHRRSLAQCLEKNGTSIKVVITSNDIVEAKQKESLRVLKGIIDNQTNNGLIEVREFKGNTHFAIMATDPKLTYGRMQIRMYMPIWENTNQPQFELYREKDAYWMNHFLEQFESIWEESTPILSNVDQMQKNDDGKTDMAIVN